MRLYLHRLQQDTSGIWGLPLTKIPRKVDLTPASRLLGAMLEKPTCMKDSAQKAKTGTQTDIYFWNTRAGGSACLSKTSAPTFAVAPYRRGMRFLAAE